MSFVVAALFYVWCVCHFLCCRFVVGSFGILSMGTWCEGEYGRKVTDTEGKRLGCKRLDEINCSVRNERWLGNKFEIDLKYMSEQRPGELHSNDGGSALMNMMTVRWAVRVRKYSFP